MQVHVAALDIEAGQKTAWQSHWGNLELAMGLEKFFESLGAQRSVLPADQPPAEK